MISAVTVFQGPDRPFHAVARVPGDKSLSHRALILAAMARGRSVVRNPGPGRDVAATRLALERFGVRFPDDVVDSPGVGEWLPAGGPIDAANSGTTMRLLAGALAARPYRSVIVGDDSLMARPMRRLSAPLGVLGAAVTVSDAGTPPVTIDGRPLRGAAVTLPIASAQVRTAVAFAALQAAGPSTITSPPGFRDHTERWLEHLGLGHRSTDTVMRIDPGLIRPIHAVLPGDTSSAAFLWAAAALHPGSSVEIGPVSLNPGRTGFLDVLATMGATVEITPTGAVLGDPVGRVAVTGGDLVATTVSGPVAVRALDELPLLGVVAAFAEGTTTIGDASELRTKESDRIASTVAMIRALGGVADATTDGFVVVGTGLTGGTVSAGGDHRIAMSAAVAASRGGRVAVDGFDAAAVSWPGFGPALEETWAS
jgi:3-phosphoshikimate 1-carboxyvinyltransferase